jgi:hypothetical protein
MQNRVLPYNTIGNRRTPNSYAGYQGYGSGDQAGPKPVQSVAEILSQGMPEMAPDLMGAQGTASRQRQIADMLMQGVQQQDNTSLAGGLSQLGQAFLARGANKKADKAEAEAQSVQAMLVQQAMQGGEQGKASIAQLLAGNPEAGIEYAMQMNAPQKPRDPFVVNDRVLNPDDPTQVLADYSDPVAPEQKQYSFEQVGDDIVAINPADPNDRVTVGKAPVKSPLVDIRLPGEGPQETAFMKEAGALEAKNFGEINVMGQTARRNRVTLDLLDASAAAIPGGYEAAIKSALGNIGIETQGLSEIQATEALINQLVPAQRPPGSGPMSDRDLALFKQSLPRLIQSTEGRAKIITNMKTINDYVLREGQIANRVLSGEMTPQEGRRQMEALGNPLAGGGDDGLPPGFVVIE